MKFHPIIIKVVSHIDEHKRSCWVQYQDVESVLGTQVFNSELRILISALVARPKRITVLRMLNTFFSLTNGPKQPAGGLFRKVVF
jgi:hypothetical protein